MGFIRGQCFKVLFKGRRCHLKSIKTSVLLSLQELFATKPIWKPFSVHWHLLYKMSGYESCLQFNLHMCMQELVDKLISTYLFHQKGIAVVWSSVFWSLGFISFIACPSLKSLYSITWYTVLYCAILHRHITKLKLHLRTIYYTIL